MLATGNTNIKDNKVDAILKSSGPINFTMFLKMFGGMNTSLWASTTIIFKRFNLDGNGSIHKEYIKGLLMFQANRMTAHQKLEFALINVAGNLDYKVLSYILTHVEEEV
ncbi:myosin light chain 5 [Mus pahari]|uniref:myosin light chain 5 n=1 Tax=Mus pahari TaxID=10093 RepID=UPI0011150525|nr:myosin light chain 5 [Mus pahari]